MKNYYFSGDMRHPCIIRVIANSEEEAIEFAKAGNFDEIVDEQDSCLMFEYDGGHLGADEGYDDAGKKVSKKEEKEILSRREGNIF